MDQLLLTHPDFRILLYAVLLLLGIYVSVMYTCWGTLSFSKVKKMPWDLNLSADEPTF